MSPQVNHHPVLRVRLVEIPLPAGSRDPEVLIDWMLNSLGLIRSKGANKSTLDGMGGINKIMSQCFLKSTSSGWTAAEISDLTGISSTGVHNQLVKLTESGLLSGINVDGKRTYMVNGGSFQNSAELIGINTLTIAKQRLRILSGHIAESQDRMEVPAENEAVPFRMNVVSLMPTSKEIGIAQLSRDLGFDGDRIRFDDDLHIDLMNILASAHKPLGITRLMEETGGTRARIGRILGRMRSAGFLERAVVASRLDLDIFTGLLRQYNARGSDWIMSRGGLSRFPKDVQKSLTDSLESGEHSLEGVEESLEKLTIDEKGLFLNMLGGRVPLGYRVKGATGDEVLRSILSGLERVVSRISTISGRLDEVILKSD